MSTVASAILAKVREDLNDTDGTRWPDAVLLGHLSDGQTVTVILKPSAYVVTTQAALVAGTRQALPAGALALIRPVRNLKADGSFERVPYLVTPAVLDILIPGWHGEPSAKTVRYVAYDQLDPKAYWVYPPQPAATDQKLELLHPALPPSVSAVGNNIALADEYVPALVDYIVYRAFAKDSEAAAAAERSQRALAAFAAKLGVPAAAARQAVQQQQQGAPQ